MNEKRLLIRADGNAVIGAGHIMRCLSIAIAAREMGIVCLFVTADDAFSEVINRSNIPHKILATDYSDMNGETDQLCEIIDSFKPTVIIVDSYSVTEKYFKLIRRYAVIFYIDDVRKFPYSVDAIINYNASANIFDYPSYYKTAQIELPQLFLGERFAPLRKEFQNLKELSTRVQVSDILFSVGGSDPERIVFQFVNCVINDEKLKNYRYHLVLGKYEPDIDKIKAIAKKHKNIIVHENITKMADLMRTCDIAISAAGSTLYELSACGIPTITYILDDNQFLGATSLSEKGIVINVGDFRIQCDFFFRLAKEIKDLCCDFKRREYMHMKAIRTIDGNGAKRLVEKIFILYGGWNS